MLSDLLVYPEMPKLFFGDTAQFENIHNSNSLKIPRVSREYIHGPGLASLGGSQLGTLVKVVS